jgi:magnesium-protoporphyrin O-methyltransferase
LGFLSQAHDKPGPTRNPPRPIASTPDEGVHLSEPTGRGCCPGDGSERASVAERIAASFDEQVDRTVTDPDALPEPSPISARLLELLADHDGTIPSVIDLGCGTGSTAIRLARKGVGHVTGIDLSPASIDIARKRAAVAGLGEDRISFEVGDAATVDFRPRDWVLLDRVICCYDDMPRLLANGLSGTGRLLGLALPDSRGWRGAINAVTWKAENLWTRVMRHSHTPGFVHDIRQIDGVLTRAGLRKVGDSVRGLWYAAVYEQAGSPGS